MAKNKNNNTNAYFIIYGVWVWWNGENIVNVSQLFVLVVEQ